MAGPVVAGGPDFTPVFRGVAVVLAVAPGAMLEKANHRPVKI